MDAERLLQEFPLLLRFHHQLLVETLQLLQTLPDVVRREVTTSDLRGSTRHHKSIVNVLLLLLLYSLHYNLNNTKSFSNERRLLTRL